MKRTYKNRLTTRTPTRRSATQSLRKKLGKRTGAMSFQQPRVSGAIAKFTKRAGPGEEIKTCDVLFTGAYAAGYTPDTVPLQQINFNSGTACVQALNLIQQGPGTSQRIGHKISMKSLRIRLEIGPVNNVAQVNPTHGRLMVIYDHNPDGAYIAANQILANITQANVVQTGTPTDNLNPNFFERMVVMMDKYIDFPPYDNGALTAEGCVGSTQTSSFQVDEFINLKNLETIYGNTTNGLATANPMTIAYVQTGALYILGYGLQAGANQPWTAVGSVRLRFRDN